MPIPLKIRDFKSVVQYADLEDLPDGTATEMKNMRIIYGKIVKTSELGAFLDEALDVASKTITGFATWIHNRLSASSQPVGSGAGYLYLIAVVDDSTKKLQIYTWNGQSETWVAIDTVAGGLDFTTASYYQTKGDDLPSQRNPIIYANEILRFLPGDTALPDGSNVAVGAWIGWIGRDYFDGLFTAASYTAKYFSYPREIVKPTFTPTIVKHCGDKAFSPSEGGIPITAIDAGEQSVTIIGEYGGLFTGGKLFIIEGSPHVDNYGEFKALTSEISSGQTKIFVDDEYKSITDITGGTVRFTVNRDARYYKFSYVYDGNQESLLSEAYKVDFEDQRFPSFEASFTNTDHNKRITAIKVYRSTTGNAGTYYHIHTIDFLRKTGQYKSAETGAYSGDRNIYIPDIGAVTPTGGVSKIWLWNNNIGDFEGYTISSYSGTRFTVSADVEDDDYWDCAWEYYANGTDLTTSGSSGAFAGQKVWIISEDLGAINYSGGVIELQVGATIGYRMVDISYSKAVHLTSGIDTAGGATNEEWKLFSIEKGLFFCALSGSTITWKFFDTALPDGAPHPLEGAVSINVNGAFARMIAGRLFQAKIVLDPADKAEEHEDWGSYSELDQPDVNPVSNVLRFQEREGGELTGLEELFGMAVFLLKQGIIAVNCKSSPESPGLWGTWESIHDIGNVAPLGAVRAGDSLYVCANDGIYKIEPNNLSDSDATPTEKLKITELINNIYNSMTAAQKRGIRGIYHHRRNEIHWFMTYPVDEVDTLKRWAYNVITGAWREVYALYDALMPALDENANALILEDLDDDTVQVAAVDSNKDEQDGRFLFRSKVFPISEGSPEPIHKIAVIYKSPHALKLRLYLDGNDTMVEDYDLPAQADMKPYTVAVGYSCYRMQFVITDDTGDALVAEETAGGPVYLIVEQNELNPNVEISGMDIVHSY